MKSRDSGVYRKQLAATTRGCGEAEIHLTQAQRHGEFVLVFGFADLNLATSGIGPDDVSNGCQVLG